MHILWLSNSIPGYIHNIIEKIPKRLLVEAKKNFMRTKIWKQQKYLLIRKDN